ncbi:HAD family hydrolase [Rhodopseudomonas palustris]
MMVELLIFDFDGVVADSEGLACDVLADYATELGAPMTRQQALDRFTGKRINDVWSAVQQIAQRPLLGFPEELQRRTLAVFNSQLREVTGVTKFLEDHSHFRRCIASSSAPERIRFSLSLLKLDGYFGDNVFSANEVARGKPFPDVFLYAAQKMRVDPSRIVVIEDSPGGVQAASAAGMMIIGLLAADHIGPDHGTKLRAAGATWIASSYDEIATILAGM